MAERGEQKQVAGGIAKQELQGKPTAWSRKRQIGIAAIS